MRYGDLERRLARFRQGPQYEDDGFRAAVGAMEGETWRDCLRRTARDDWSDYPRELLPFDHANEGPGEHSHSRPSSGGR